MDIKFLFNFHKVIMLRWRSEKPKVRNSGSGNALPGIIVNSCYNNILFKHNFNMMINQLMRRSSQNSNFILFLGKQNECTCIQKRDYYNISYLHELGLKETHIHCIHVRMEVQIAFVNEYNISFKHEADSGTI